MERRLAAARPRCARQALTCIVRIAVCVSHTTRVDQSSDVIQSSPARVMFIASVGVRALVSAGELSEVCSERDGFLDWRTHKPTKDCLESWLRQVRGDVLDCREMLPDGACLRAAGCARAPRPTWFTGHRARLPCSRALSSLARTSSRRSSTVCTPQSAMKRTRPRFAQLDSRFAVPCPCVFIDGLAVAVSRGALVLSRGGGRQSLLDRGRAGGLDLVPCSRRINL